MPKVTKTNLNRTVKCNVCSGWFKRQGMQKHFKAKHFNALGIGQKMKLDNLYRECNLGKLDIIVKIKGLCDRNEKKSNSRVHGGIQTQWTYGFRSLSQTHFTQLRHVYRNDMFISHLYTAAVRTSAKHTDETREVACKFLE